MLGGNSGNTLGGDGKHDLWRHLSLLAKVESKDSMEEVLRTLWRTRRTGLSPADRADLRGALQVQSDAELDPLLVCLRVLIRGCMTAAEALREEQSEGGDVDGSLVDVEALIPADEVGLEVRRLLGLVLQKLLREWLEDVAKEKAEAASAAAAAAAKRAVEADAERSSMANEVQDSSERPSPTTGGEQPPAAEELAIARSTPNAGAEAEAATANGHRSPKKHTK